MAGSARIPLQRGLAGLFVPLLVFLAGCPQPVECLRCQDFALTGNFLDARIDECSGLAASAKNPGVLWVHNDSGDGPRLFAVQEDGSLRGVYELEGAVAVDWEDMAGGPCAAPAASHCLYVGDIGDNAESRTSVQVYRVEEPAVPPAGSPEETTLHDVERFDCRYPDGAHNAETLLVDPVTGIPYIVTKSPLAETGVYRFPGVPAAGGTVVLDKVTTLDGRSFLTGGDQAADGSRVVLRDYVAAYDYPLAGGLSFEQIFFQTPCLVPLALEPQGEALAVDPSGLKLYTASEGVGGPVNKAACEYP